MERMPMIFVGHGSPMNAIEDNKFTNKWKDMAKTLPSPKAILAISAHWYTRGTEIMIEENPKTIYDMYGFPEELYKIVYDSKGSPELAKKVKQLISNDTKFDDTWGIDHGTWSVLVHMYPKRDIPVIQLSINAYAEPSVHYKIGRELKSLRDEGVLIFGSGNIVHNLRILDWDMAEGGFDWAHTFDDFIEENIKTKNHENIINYAKLGQVAKLAVPSPDHFNPILYLLGAVDEEDTVEVYNKDYMMGSLSMTSYIFR